MQIKSYSAALIGMALLSTTALAADLPSRRAPPVFVPPPIPVFTWTGLYIGGQVGYQFGRSNAYGFDNGGRGVVAAGSSPNGIVGGGHAGYNFSTQSLPFLNGFGGGFGGGGILFGIEGDVDGSDYKKTYALGGISNQVREDIQGSIRGRVGLTYDRVLFYATGGAAFGDLQNTYVNTLNGLTDHSDHTRVGYTVGGGIEYAITNNFSLRAEYRYTDYGTFTENLAASQAGGLNVRHHETNNRVQAGFSYRFATPVAAPVIARY